MLRNASPSDSFICLTALIVQLEFDRDLVVLIVVILQLELICISLNFKYLPVEDLATRFLLVVEACFSCDLRQHVIGLLYKVLFRLLSGKLHVVENIGVEIELVNRLIVSHWGHFDNNGCLLIISCVLLFDAHFLRYDTQLAESLIVVDRGFKATETAQKRLCLTIFLWAGKSAPSTMHSLSTLGDAISSLSVSH